MELFTRNSRPLTRQPPGIPTLRAHPLTRGLLFCAYPIGRTFIDLVTRVVGTPTGALSLDRKPANQGFSRNGDALALSASGSTDQVAWPASSTLRGGTAIQQGTILCLGGINEQVSTKQYFFGSSMSADGSGMSLRISTGLTGSAGSIMRGKSSTTAIGWSTAQMLGATPGLATHFFGYSYNSNGANGTWYGARTSEAWTGGSTFGTGNTTRKALIYTDYDTAGYSEKKTYVGLFLIYDRELSLVEYQTLYDNLWLILQPPTMGDWLPTAADFGGLLVLNASLVDGATAADINSASTAFNATLLDPATGADVLSAEATRNASLQDSAAGADGLSASAALAASLADAAAGTDLTTIAPVRGATLTDAASGAELLSAASAFAASLLDAAAGSDTANAGAVLNSSLLDGVSGSDILSAISTLQASLVDGASADDLRSASRIAAATVMDAAAGADINSTGTTFNRSLVDSASGADALQAAAMMVASLVDQATVADQFNAAQQLTVLLTDAAAGSDLRSGSVPVTYNVSLLDLAYALDVLSGVLGGGPLLVPSRSRGVDYALAPLGVDYALRSQGVDCYAV